MMPTFMHRFPIDEFFPAASLFGDFAARRDGPAVGVLGRFDADSELWSRCLEPASETEGVDRDAFFQSLAAYNRTIGASDRVVTRLGDVPAGRSRVLITGQQPGVLGGPLMTLYKIETVIALAARVESEHGVPCVPVYWMGADDDDFAEIRELVILNAELRALSTSLPSGAHEVAMPVGNIDADWLRQLWDGIDAFVGGFEGGAAVIDAVSAALEHAGDHAGVSARIVSALAGGEVAVFDARDGALREAAAGTILEYFDREDEIRSAVESGGRWMESSGFQAQVNPGPDSGVFLLDDGRRTKIPSDRRREARSRIAADPRRAYPGVVLRNLVQDVVFDPVAVVLGPAEIAYRAQVRGVYDLTGIRVPVTFPRLFATYVPPAVAGMLEEAGSDVPVLVRSTPEFVKRVFASRTDQALVEARRRIEETFERESEAFLAAATASMDRGAVEKMRKRLADVSRRLSQATAGVSEAGRARALERWPFLESLAEVFARRGQVQERYLSMLSPFLFGGCRVDDCVRAVARAHVDATMDGRVEHIVYSQ